MRRVRHSWQAGLALIALAWVIFLYLANARPWQRRLIVWCCGSNYESQVDFARDFGRRHGVKVMVVGAPVQYLLELAGRTSRRPDVIVGRAGPGWKWLKQRGLLEYGPIFFGVDPFVLVVPPENEAKVQDLTSIRSGPWAAFAPHAMRPKGMCIIELLHAASIKFDLPGIDETFMYSVKHPLKCARLTPQLLKREEAFVAITQSSQLSLPEWKGLKRIDIDPKYMLAMTTCRATIPQCAAVLSGSRMADLARAYVDEMAGQQGRQILERHGYVHITNPKIKPYRPMLKLFVPKNRQYWQVVMARELMADGLWPEALRRWLKVLHVFGPSPYDAQARFMAGWCALQAGSKFGAYLMWKRCAEDYPRLGPAEWRGVQYAVCLHPPTSRDADEAYWAARARAELEKLRAQGIPGWGANLEPSDVTDAFYNNEPRKIQIIQADVPKGSRRNLAVAEDLLACEQFSLALTDYNKVYTLDLPNHYIDLAMWRAGECAWLMGNRAAAVDVWTFAASAYTGQPWADDAGRLVRLAATEQKVIEDKALPEGCVQILKDEMPTIGEGAFWWQRGLGNAWWDFRSRLLAGALKECFKVLHLHYTAPKDKQFRRKLAAEARYFAGIYCAWLGQPEAACQQWRKLARYGDEWRAKAHAALAELKAELKKMGRGDLAASLSLDHSPPKAAAINDPAVPADIDGDLRIARLVIDDNASDKKFSARWHHIALEIFLCRQFRLALHEFTKVISAVNVKDEGKNPFQAEALYFMGACLEQIGNLKRAKARWQQVIERYPDSPWAARAKRRLAAAGR